MQQLTELQQVNDLINHSNLSSAQREELATICAAIPRDALQSLVTDLQGQLLSTLNQGVSVPLDEVFTAWTSEDLGHYYTLICIITSKSTQQIRARASTVLTGMPITSDDDLPSLPASFPKIETPTPFGQLKHLAQVAAYLSNNQTEVIFFRYLIALLTSYRNQILSLKDSASPTSPEAIELVFKVDCITDYFANYFHDVIINNTQEDEFTLLFVKDCLTRVGSLKGEIFPKLARFFKDTLRSPAVSKDEVDIYIERFLAFHSLIEKKTLLDLIQLMGFHTLAAVKLELKTERLKQDFIFSDDGAQCLENIRIYLRHTELSPHLVHLIIFNLSERAKNPDLQDNDDFAFCIHRVMQCIRQQPDVYINAQDFLYLLETYQYSSKSTVYVSLEPEINPGLIVGILERSDVNAAVSYALKHRYLPPSANLFYAMLQENIEHTQDIISNLEERNPILCHEILTLIFSDDTYSEQHQQWLAQKETPFLKRYQSLLFLKKITVTSPSPEVIPSEVLWPHWLNCIDSELIINPYILSHTVNRALLAQLVILQNTILTTTLNMRQTKTLCIALALYHDEQVQVSQGGFFRGPSVDYPEEVKWAETLLVTLLDRIAYPNNCPEMSFPNVLTFLELKFNHTRVHSIDTIGEQVIEDFGIISTIDLEGKLAHTNKFVNLFAKLFLHKQANTLSLSNVYLGSLLLQLPTTYLALIDVAFACNQIDIPFWTPTKRRNQILTVLARIAFQQSMMTVLTDHPMEGIDESNLPESSRSIMHLFGATPQEKQKKIRIISYFVTEIYRAYCVLHPDRTDQNILQTEAHAQLRQSVREPLQTILTAMETNLHADRTNIAICYERLKWICYLALSCGINLYPAIEWFADMLGYNMTANIKQLEHFRKLDAYFQNHEMINPAECQWLKKEIQSAIETNQYKLHWWMSNHYHHQLILLEQQLSASEVSIQQTNASSNNMRRPSRGQTSLPPISTILQFGLLKQEIQPSTFVEGNLTPEGGIRF